MSPRTGVVAAFLLVLASPAIGQTLAPSAQAQQFSQPSISAADLAASQAAAQAYSDAQLVAFNTTLNSAPSIAGFAAAMVAANEVASPQSVTAAITASAPALAPVQSVNAQTGSVTVPTFSRRFSNVPVSSTTGAATFTFSPVFPGATAPTCFTDIASSNTGYVFLSPQQTAISTSAVSYVVTAMSKTLTVNTLGLATPLTTTPPTGTTLNVTCIAPNN